MKTKWVFTKSRVVFTRRLGVVLERDFFGPGSRLNVTRVTFYYKSRSYTFERVPA